MAVADTQKFGKYEILEELGRGGMGVVYKARDPIMGRMVALKTLITGAGNESDLLKRFYREAQAAGRLQHPNIITIYDVGEVEGRPFIVMQYLDGATLEKIIAVREPLSMAQKVGILLQFCRGLDFAHKSQVVHRDVKPANIFVETNGAVKVLDFGIVHIAATTMTSTGMVIGTPHYMSPEQIRGEHIDHRSDIFSVGTVAYEFLTYTKPFDGPNLLSIMFKITSGEQKPLPIDELVPDVPPVLAQAIAKCHEQRAEDRYQSLADLVLDLEPLEQSLKRQMIGDLVSQAKALYDQKDYGKAKEVLREVLVLDNSLEVAKSLMARVTADLRRLEITSRVEHLVEEGHQFLSQGKPTEASRSLEEALKLDSQHRQALTLFHEARARLEREKALRTSLSAVQAALGKGDLTVAAAELTKAITIGIEHPDLLVYQERIKEARERERRLRIQQALLFARQLLAEGRYDEAVKELEQLGREFPGEAGIEELLAGGREKLARQQKRLQVETQVAIIQKLIGEHKLQEAVGRLNELGPRCSQDAELSALYGSTRQQLEEALNEERLERELAAIHDLIRSETYASAVQRAQTLQRQYPDNHEVQRLLGYSQDLHKKAEQERAFAALCQSVQSLLDSGRYKDAVRESTAALVRFPGNLALSGLLAAARDGEARQAARVEQERLAKRIAGEIASIENIIATKDYKRAVSRTEALQNEFPNSAEVGRLLDQVRTSMRNEERLQLEALRQSVQSLLDSGRHKDAVREATAALDRFPGNAALSNLLTAARDGEAQQALQIEREKLKKQIAREIKAIEKVLEAKDFQTALRRAEELSREHPSDAEVGRLLDRVRTSAPAEPSAPKPTKESPAGLPALESGEASLPSLTAMFQGTPRVEESTAPAPPPPSRSAAELSTERRPAESSEAALPSLTAMFQGTPRVEEATTPAPPPPSTGWNVDLNDRIETGTKPSRIDDDVQFTVYRPLVVPPEEWRTLLAFAHRSARAPGAPSTEPDPVKRVQEQAIQILGNQIGRYQALVHDSAYAIPSEGELTFVPEMTGVTFSPRSHSFLWQDPVPPANFLFKASKELDGKTARGSVCVFFGSIVVAQIPLKIRVDSSNTRRSKHDTAEAVQSPMCRKIFASYSHDDTAVVEEFERYAEAFGDDYIRDVKKLRSGETWDARLLTFIENADVFQLFWSSKSMYSANVQREYWHALSLKRERFVRPVYWELPLPTSPESGLPPTELLALHFHQVSLRGSSPLPIHPIERRRPESGVGPTALERGVEPAEAGETPLPSLTAMFGGAPRLEEAPPPSPPPPSISAGDLSAGRSAAEAGESSLPSLTAMFQGTPRLEEAAPPSPPPPSISAGDLSAGRQTAESGESSVPSLTAMFQGTPLPPDVAAPPVPPAKKAAKDAIAEPQTAETAKPPVGSVGGVLGGKPRSKEVAAPPAPPSKKAAKDAIAERQPAESAETPVGSLTAMFEGTPRSPEVAPPPAPPPKRAPKDATSGRKAAEAAGPEPGSVTGVFGGTRAHEAVIAPAERPRREAPAPAKPTEPTKAKPTEATKAKPQVVTPAPVPVVGAPVPLWKRPVVLGGVGAAVVVLVAVVILMQKKPPTVGSTTVQTASNQGAETPGTATSSPEPSQQPTVKNPPLQPQGTSPSGKVAPPVALAEPKTENAGSSKGNVSVSPAGNTPPPKVAPNSGTIAAGPQETPSKGSQPPSGTVPTAPTAPSSPPAQPATGPGPTTNAGGSGTNPTQVAVVAPPPPLPKPPETTHPLSPAPLKPTISVSNPAPDTLGGLVRANQSVQAKYIDGGIQAAGELSLPADVNSKAHQGDKLQLLCVVTTDLKVDSCSVQEGPKEYAGAVARAAEQNFKFTTGSQNHGLYLRVKKGKAVPVTGLAIVTIQY